VGPLPGDQDATAGDAEVFGFVGLAFAVPGSHGVPGSLGLDAVEQPHRTAWRAQGDLEFGVQPAGMIPLPIRGSLAEPGGLPNAFGEVHRESLTAYSLA
jgi:hypothetical protein